jgi:hypothetical protein
VSKEVDLLLDLRYFVENEAFDHDPYVMETRIVKKMDEILKEITNGKG